MTRTQSGIMVGITVAALALGAVGCTPEFRSRVAEALARLASQPDLATLVREVAGILLSDEWREQLAALSKVRGEARVRIAVKACADAAPELAEFRTTYRSGVAHDVRGVREFVDVLRVRDSDARTIKLRAAAWLVENREK